MMQKTITVTKSKTVYATVVYSFKEETHNLEAIVTFDYDEMGFGTLTWVDIFDLANVKTLFKNPIISIRVC